jgi:hypothetical protein
MTDIYKKVKDAFSYEDQNKLHDELDKIPEGIVYGKKIRKNGLTVTYNYSEKQRAILDVMHGLDIEENTEKFLRESFDLDDYDDDEETDT